MDYLFSSATTEAPPSERDGIAKTKPMTSETERIELGGGDDDDEEEEEERGRENKMAGEKAETEAGAGARTRAERGGSSGGKVGGEWMGCPEGGERNGGGDVSS